MSSITGVEGHYLKFQIAAANVLNSSSSLACRTLIFAAVLAQFFKVFVEFSPSSETAEEPVPKVHHLHSH